jgi:hypothetical protein
MLNFIKTLYILVIFTTPILGQNNKKAHSETYLSAYISNTYESYKSVFDLPDTGSQRRVIINKDFALKPQLGVTKRSKSGILTGYYLSELYLFNKKIEDDNIPLSGTIKGNGMISRKIEITILRMAWRFEKSYPLSKNGSFQPYLGLSLDPYFEFNQILPLATAFFKDESWTLGNSIYIIPRLLIPNKTEKWHFDISLPLHVVDFNFIYSRWSNPILPNSLRNSKDFKTVFLPKKSIINFRIGIGFKI